LEGRDHFSIADQQSNRRVIGIEVAAVYTGQTSFLLHNLCKIAAWRRRLIDHPQITRLYRKKCEINRCSLIRLRIFQTNLAMHNAGVSRL
jgi:hypothetical protein